MPKALDLSLALLLITSHLIHSQGTLTFVQGYPLFALDTALPCLPFQCVTDWEGACAGLWQASGMEAQLIVLEKAVQRKH